MSGKTLQLFVDLRSIWDYKIELMQITNFAVWIVAFVIETSANSMLCCYKETRIIIIIVIILESLAKDKTTGSHTTQHQSMCSRDDL